MVALVDDILELQRLQLLLLCQMWMHFGRAEHSLEASWSATVVPHLSELPDVSDVSDDRVLPALVVAVRIKGLLEVEALPIPLDFLVAVPLFEQNHAGREVFGKLGFDESFNLHPCSNHPHQLYYQLTLRYPQVVLGLQLGGLALQPCDLYFDLFVFLVLVAFPKLLRLLLQTSYFGFVFVQLSLVLLVKYRLFYVHLYPHYQ